MWADAPLSSDFSKRDLPRSKHGTAGLQRIGVVDRTHSDAKLLAEFEPELPGSELVIFWFCRCPFLTHVLSSLLLFWRPKVIFELSL